MAEVDKNNQNERRKREIHRESRGDTERSIVSKTDDNRKDVKEVLEMLDAGFASDDVKKDWAEYRKRQRMRKTGDVYRVMDAIEVAEDDLDETILMDEELHQLCQHCDPQEIISHLINVGAIKNAKAKGGAVQGKQNLEWKFTMGDSEDWSREKDFACEPNEFEADFDLPQSKRSSRSRSLSGDKWKRPKKS